MKTLATAARALNVATRAAGREGLVTVDAEAAAATMMMSRAGFPAAAAAVMMAGEGVVVETTGPSGRGSLSLASPRLLRPEIGWSSSAGALRVVRGTWFGRSARAGPPGFRRSDSRCY